jgi:hypothetical protein
MRGCEPVPFRRVHFRPFLQVRPPSMELMPGISLRRSVVH